MIDNEWSTLYNAFRKVDELSEISLTSQLPPMPSSQILGHFKRAIIRINEEVKRLETVKPIVEITYNQCLIIQIKAEAELNLPQSKVELEIEEGDEGAIDAVLDEEAAKIKEAQAKEKHELVKALQQYKIKVWLEIPNSLLISQDVFVFKFMTIEGNYSQGEDSERSVAFIGD